jgi:hypothetical protein
MLKETRIVEEALLATPSADRPKSVAHHRCCDTTASAERHAKNPVRGRAELRLEGTLWMVFMLVLAFVLVFGGLGCFPYPHECDAAVDFIFRKNLAGFLKFP